MAHYFLIILLVFKFKRRQNVLTFILTFNCWRCLFPSQLTPYFYLACLSDVPTSRASHWYESNQCTLKCNIHQSISYIRLSCSEALAAALYRCCDLCTGHGSITGLTHRQNTFTLTFTPSTGNEESPVHRTCIFFELKEEKSRNRRKTLLTVQAAEASSCNNQNGKIKP